MTLFQKYEFLLLRMGNCLGFRSERWHIGIKRKTLW